MTRRRALLAAAPAAFLLAARGASALSLPASFAQGGYVAGRAAPGTRLALDGRPVRVSPEGHFAFGFARDAGAEAVLSVEEPGRPPERRGLDVRRREWAVQRLTGLPERMVTPDEAALARIRAEQVRLNAARAVETRVPHFAGGLDWPARGRISGVFGSQRVLNGQPRAPHLGLDVAGPVGTPVATCAPGRVTLAADDLYFTGGTVLVEHGHGITTLYAHLSRLDVSEGQEVGRGQVIGLMGATGRVTGPHLHLGLFWGATALDPATALPPGREPG